MTAAGVLERRGSTTTSTVTSDEHRAPIDLVGSTDPPSATGARSVTKIVDQVETGQVASGQDESGQDEDGSPSDVVCLDSLVAAAVADVPGARDRLLAQIHPFVLRYCRGRLGRQESVSASADDVAQEVCLAVVSALPSYTVKGLSFRAFVYGIAAHKVTDAFRAMGRNRAEPVADLPDSPIVDGGPEHRVLTCERDERLGELLQMLTPRQREVLVLRIAVGLSAEETAAAVRSTPGAVRVTQHRALNRLRAVVGGNADTLGLLGYQRRPEPEVEVS